MDCCGFASRMRRANALCTLLRAATSRCNSRSIALPIRSAGAFWWCVCARDRLRLAFADNPNLPFRVCATTGGGGDTCGISTCKFVVSVRAGMTNDVPTSEVAKVLSASSPACSASAPACCGTLPCWHKAKMRLSFSSQVWVGRRYSPEVNFKPTFVLKRVKIFATLESRTIAVAHQSSIRH